VDPWFQPHTHILLPKVLCSKLTKGGGGSTCILQRTMTIGGGGGSKYNSTIISKSLKNDRLSSLHFGRIKKNYLKEIKTSVSTS
jgi:hypothetical protein